VGKARGERRGLQRVRKKGGFVNAKGQKVEKDVNKKARRKPIRPCRGSGRPDWIGPKESDWSERIRGNAPSAGP